MSIFPEGRPPDTLVISADVWSVSRPSDLARIRGAMTRVAAGRPEQAAWDGPRTPLLAAIGERLGVVFSELATNALRHGREPITASLGRARDGWVVSIEDCAVTAPLLQSASPVRPGGHGLRLVLTLSRAAGWYRIGQGKCVWAEVGDEPPEGLLRQLNGARSSTGIAGH